MIKIIRNFMKNHSSYPFTIIAIFLMLYCNLSIFSNENIPGFYEADVSPHYLSIELNNDSNFTITDAGGLYPKRITKGIWTVLNDSIICINSHLKNFPISEFGVITNYSIKIKVVDSINNPLKKATLLIKYQDSSVIQGYTDSAGICNIPYYQVPIEVIQVNFMSNMFFNTLNPNKVFSSNILIKYIPLENSSIIENQYYLYSNDSLFSLGDKYEYYDIFSTLAFKKTNDFLKFLELLKYSKDYFYDLASTDFFEDDLNSVNSIIFIDLATIIETYFVKFSLFYTEHKVKDIQKYNITNLIDIYYTNLDKLINRFYKKSTESLNDEEFQNYIAQFGYILEEINVQLQSFSR